MFLQRQVRWRERWLAFLSKERRMSVFFRWDEHAFPSYRNNIVYFNILRTGYRYRQSYRRKRASRLVVSNLEIRHDRYAMGSTGRSLKLVSSENIKEQSQHQKSSAKTVEYRVVIAQPLPRWDIGLEHPYRYRVLLARTTKSRRAGRGELPSTLVNLRLGIARSRICGCR